MYESRWKYLTVINWLTDLSLAPKDCSIKSKCRGLWSEPEWEQVHSSYYCGCLLDCEQMTASLKQNTTKVHGRLISKRCEVMPEINSYPACVWLINHLSAFGVWVKREKSAASTSADPEIPIAGVAEWPCSLIASWVWWDFTTWFTCICPWTEMSMLYTRTAVANGDSCRNTNARFRLPNQTQSDQRFSIIDLHDNSFYSLLASVAEDGFEQP